MIRTVSEILSDLGQKYRQPQMKLRQMTLRGEITQVIRGLYETDKNTPGEALAGAIYGPSYLSFDYALSRHGLGAVSRRSALQPYAVYARLVPLR